MQSNSLFIVFISICTALLGGGLTWLMVYRTDKFQKLKTDVEKQSKRLLQKKKVHDNSLDKNI